MIKILLLNLPGGRIRTDFPPVGISRVIEGISPEIECDVSFYDLDSLRPDFEQIKAKLADFSPQIIGFSAILTPAFKYLKALSIYLKKEFPGMIQVLGGEMAVIYEIILKSTAIDFCVVGQSEPPFSELILALNHDNFLVKDTSSYSKIPGLVFRDKGKPFFTGPAPQSSPVRQVNYDLLSKFTNISRYVQEVNGQYYKARINPGDLNDFFSLFHKANLNKKMAALFASKGCVGRCTFCHRYFKGYKALPAGQVTGDIQHLINNHNVGMILFSEEDFGSDRRSTAEIVDFLKKKNLNWSAGGVRVTNLDENTIKNWKEAGCVNVNFGIESCSQKILDVMEKNSRVEDNLNALRLCSKHRIATIISLVLGMPGETEETVDETISSLAGVIPDDISLVYEISINFFQAVPGTAAYEFAKHMGVIDASLSGEEKYIEGLHNAGATEFSQYLNFTDYETEEVLYWNDYVLLELYSAYLGKHGVLKVLKRKKAKRFYYAAIYRLLPRKARRFLLKYYTVVKHHGLSGLADLLRRKWFVKRPAVYAGIDRSLRLINKDFEAGKICST